MKTFGFGVVFIYLRSDNVTFATHLSMASLMLGGGKAGISYARRTKRKLLLLGTQGWLTAARGCLEFSSTFVTCTYSAVPISQCCSTLLKFNLNLYADFRGTEEVSPLTRMGENYVLGIFTKAFV